MVRVTRYLVQRLTWEQVGCIATGCVSRKWRHTRASLPCTQPPFPKAQIGTHKPIGILTVGKLLTTPGLKLKGGPVPDSTPSRINHHAADEPPRYI